MRCGVEYFVMRGTDVKQRRPVVFLMRSLIDVRRGVLIRISCRLLSGSKPSHWPRRATPTGHAIMKY
jgi:hypothetical protein